MPSQSHNDHLGQVYRSSWWSIELQPGWTASEGANCVSFSADPPNGVLQASAAHKPNGSVTLEDLYDYASEPASQAKGFRTVAFGDISGIASERVKNNLCWREWWLKKGSTMVYLTYNVPIVSKVGEVTAIDKIVSSILIHS
jgi:hypothetical protein